MFRIGLPLPSSSSLPARTRLFALPFLPWARRVNVGGGWIYVGGDGRTAHCVRVYVCMCVCRVRHCAGLLLASRHRGGIRRRTVRRNSAIDRFPTHPLWGRKKKLRRPSVVACATLAASFRRFLAVSRRPRALKLPRSIVSNLPSGYHPSSSFEKGGK